MGPKGRRRARRGTEPPVAQPCLGPFAPPQIVWHTDPMGRIEDMPRRRAYTGQSQDEAAGWGWLDAVHPFERERVRRA